MKQMSRILCIAVLWLTANAMSAYDFIYNNLCYSFIGTSTEVEVVGCYATGNVVVPTKAAQPSNGREYVVKRIAASAFSRKSITSVTISYGVTEIGKEAFSWCSSLTSVGIPGSVTAIGERAFYYCSNLQSVTMGDGVTSIERSTFEGCEKLTDITLSSAIEKIGTWAFNGCKALENITLPASLKTLGEYGVDDDGNHYYVYYPADEESDASYSYYWYKSPFPNCSSLKRFQIASSNTSFMTIDGVLYSKSGKVLYEFPQAKGPSYVMPEGVKYTNDYVFQGCKNLTSLTLSDDLQLGFSVFYGNDMLENLYIGKTLTAYQNKNNPMVDNVPALLSSLNSLVSITVSSQSSTLQVYSGALYRVQTDGTKRLLCYPKKRTSETLEIADNCSTIGAEAFMNHYYLRHVVMPECVQNIEKSVFSGCSNLAKVTFLGSVNSIGNNVFNNCSSLSEVIIMATVPPTVGDDQDNTHTKVTLYVPYGYKAAYEAADYWKDFKEIVEMEPESIDMTDISTLDNVIYIEPMEARTASQATISFKMKNSVAIRGFQFDLYLPEGVTVVKSNKGKIQGALSAGRLPDEDEHTLTFGEQPDGAIRFLCGSQYDETFTGNDGEIATLLVNISEDMEDGDYAIKLKNVTLTETDISHYYTTDLVQSKLTVISYVVGDINGDGKVDVLDYTGVANHILGNTPAGFNAKAADVNEDGTIDVLDYTGIANIILTGSIYGTNKTMTKVSAKKIMNNQ